MKSSRFPFLPSLCLFGLAAGAGLSFDARDSRLDSLLTAFSSRALGPYRAGSWVTAIAAPLSPAREHLYTLYVGTRNGGVWKTTNSGTTFEPIFDGQPRLSIGDVAVAPSDPNIVWVGTGEAHCARSSNSGDGVYRSADAGKTWRNMGLRDTHHIARILIHPRDPETVYVAAMGHLFTANAERGVFKTTDGGRTWRKILFINDRVGAVELALVESAPGILYAAMYDKVRRPWHYELGGPESGIYKTTDAGESWARLGGGLPSGRIGRIGLDVFRRDPKVLCAVIENGNRRPPTEREVEAARRRGVEPGPRTVGNEVYRSDDAGLSWRKINAGSEDALNKAPYSFNVLRLDPEDADTVYITGQSLVSTTDGGKTWKGLGWPSDGVFPKAFGDWRALWVDPQDRDRLVLGSDGGVNVSYDRGRTSRHYANMPLGEFYAVGVDMEDPYNVYGGLQDHDSWKGPSNGWAGEISAADWVTVGGGDGMYNCVDPIDSRWVYNNREMGTMWRFDQKTGTQTLITPRRGRGEKPLRFNWTPPLALSPHNPAIVYAGAQVVFRSLDRGARWQEISPDLTTDEDAKQHGEGHISFCTLTTLAESPVKPGVIWTGSDDGRVQVTLDGGATWLDRTAALAAAGAPADFWVSRVFPSPHDAATCFLAKTGWRADDYRPALYKTTDSGATWTSLSGGLPAEASLHAVVQDRKNPDLIFIGSELGVFVSLDGGRAWRPFRAGMPPVKVTDLVIHPREDDLVVATYGRGLYIVDVAPLQELTAGVLDEPVRLFDIEPRVQRTEGAIDNFQFLGDDHLFTPNEPNAVVVTFYLKDAPRDKIKITVTDLAGTSVAEIAAPAAAGLNRVLWDMKEKPAAGGTANPWAAWDRPFVAPGTYVVTLEAAGAKLVKKAVIEGRQGWSVGPFPIPLEER